MTFLGILGLIIFVIIIPGLISGLIYFLSMSILLTFLIPAILALVLLLIYLSAGLRVIIEYERGLLFVFGQYRSLKHSGLILYLPLVENLVKVPLRVEVADAPPQEIITRDNIPLNINAVAYYRVENPEKAILVVNDYRFATFQIAQTTIRSIVGQYEMDDILTKRDEINSTLKGTIDKETSAWGIKIELVELKDVELPNNLKRAMAKQAEAERERRARVILATGELEASEKLAKAGKMVTSQDGALQLRLLQTLQEISVEKNSTIVFPFPIEILKWAQK